MDKAFTQDIADWLETPREERDVRKGAELLLRINGNRHIYQLAMIRPETAHNHVEADLKKFLQIRLDGHTMESVRQMDSELIPKVQNIITTRQDESEDAESAATTTNYLKKFGLSMNAVVNSSRRSSKSLQNCSRWRTPRLVIATKSLRC